MKIKVIKTYTKDLTPYTDLQGRKWIDESYLYAEDDKDKYDQYYNSRDQEPPVWPIVTVEDAIKIDMHDYDMDGMDLEEMDYDEDVKWEVVREND